MIPTRGRAGKPLVGAWVLVQESENAIQRSRLESAQKKEGFQLAAAGTLRSLAVRLKARSLGSETHSQ